MFFDRLRQLLTPRLWGVFVVCLVGLLVLKLIEGVNIETNILALLPVTEQDALVESASQQFNEATARRHLILVGSASLERAIEVSDRLAARISGFPGVQKLDFLIDQQRQKDLVQAYFPHRAFLLDAATRAQLQAESGEAFLKDTLKMMYSPLVPISSGLLAEDPLLLFYRFVSGQASGFEKISLQQGVLTASYKGRFYVLINITLDRSPFSLDLQQTLLPRLDRVVADTLGRNDDVEILNVGVARYAQASVESARREISTIGLGSLIGIVALFWVVFRSPWPLLIGLIPIAVGFVAAFTACQWLFGSVHLLTLVFGSSLIGISIDYSFHFFSDRLGGGEGWTGQRGIARIFNGITLGLITSLLGYSSLCFAPFPGMQQMAVFSTIGLSAAFLTVVCLFPVLAGKPAGWRPKRDWVALAGRLAAGMRWPLPVVVLVLTIAVGWGVTGMVSLQGDDDIRLLQSAPADLRTEEQRAVTILGRRLTNQFLLIEGDTEDDVLQREEALRGELERLRGNGQLESYDALSSHLPSVARQRQNYQLVKQQLLADPRLLEEYGQQLGLEVETLQAFREQYVESTSQPLALQNWLNSAAGEPWRHLWIGPTERGFASVISVYGGDSSALSALEKAQVDVSFVDKVNDISELLGQYRHRAGVLVALSYTLIYGLLCWRYGAVRSLRILLPPLMSVVMVLGALGWMAQPMNLFHLLALLLVLGIGVDYTLFLEEGRDHRNSTILAILLSGLTTLLTFGLLALSSTPAVSAFGFSVLLGMVVCLVLSPVVCGRDSEGGG